MQNPQRNPQNNIEEVDYDRNGEPLDEKILELDYEDFLPRDHHQDNLVDYASWAQQLREYDDGVLY